MDEKDDIEFIDEEVSEKEGEYVWKKKKAVHNKTSKCDIAEDFVTFEELEDECSDFSSCENSLSPKAPLFVEHVCPNSKTKSVLKHDFDFTDDITIKVSFKNDKFSIKLGHESRNSELSDSVSSQKSGLDDSFGKYNKFENSTDAHNNVSDEAVTENVPNSDVIPKDGEGTKDAKGISVSDEQTIGMVNTNDRIPLVKEGNSSTKEGIVLTSSVFENVNANSVFQTANSPKQNETLLTLEPENCNVREHKSEGDSEILAGNNESKLSKYIPVSDNESFNEQNLEEKTDSDKGTSLCSANDEDTHRSRTSNLESIINLGSCKENKKVNNGGSQYENSLQVLLAFRNNLMPGITAATNWIDSCDQFIEDDIGVTSFISTLNYDNENCEVKETSKYKVEGESRYGGSVECRRATVSTGAAKPTLNGADIVSRFSNNETRHILPSCRHNCNNENSDHICESNGAPVTAGCDTVVEPKFIDQEIQVANSFCSNCELRLLDKNSIDSTECVLSGENGLESDNNNFVCNREKKGNVNCSVAENVGEHGEEVCKEKNELNEFDNKNIDNFIKGKYLNDTLHSKTCKKELKCVKDLPLIFPRLNIPKINDVVVNVKVGETVRLKRCDAGATISLEPSNNNYQLAPDNGLNSGDNENAEIDIIEKEESEERNKDQEKNETCILRHDNESVMNFDEMKQKKKTEENRNKKIDSDEQICNTSGCSVDYCNGRTNQNMLKSALKRGTVSKKSKKKNRVQFDESLNKFFDADYVILIREEFEDYEEECGLSVCNCGDQYCYEDCCEESEDDEDDYTVQETPSSPKFDLCTAFEPPIEFVDQVTLSPPDGYKDISSHSCCSHRHHHHHVHLNQQDQRRQYDENGEWLAEEQKQSDVEEENVPMDEPPEEEQITGSVNQADTSSHSQQQIPVQQQQRYIVETITMTTVTERRIVREADDHHQVHKQPSSDVQEESKLSGILKGGKLWKSTDSCNQTDFDDNVHKSPDSSEQAEDEDNKRSVRFNESKDETLTKEIGIETDNDKLSTENGTELNLTFKVGNHLLISSNSSKPNSAVRQLFPSSKFILNRSPTDECNDDNKYLLTAESLKLFEETKKSKLLQYYNKDNSSLKSPQENDEDEDDDSLKNNLIKRTIERNTLRRSLLKYPNDIKFRKKQNKVENSLVERIKQLTCDVDENEQQKNEEENDDRSNNKTKEDGEQIRTNPPGEESQKRFDKITTSTYKKFTDLFSRRDKLEAVHPSVLTTPVPIQHQYSYYKPVYNQTSPPDLGNGSNIITKNMISRNSVTTEARKQFLSSLAPLTACVSGNSEDAPTIKDAALNVPGERSSVASTSTAGTEYSINDIDEVLNNDEVKTPQKPPDVLCGTPAGNNEQDELALFVQQDAGRIERIKKRYNAAQNNSDDDENDDYGFNRRPSVRGIKPRFGSTTEILQQMQSQLQPPPLACSSRAGSHITWPCYTPDSTRNRTEPRSVMPMVKDDDGYNYIPCANYDHESNDTRLSYQQQVLYSTNLHQPMRIPGGGDFIYQRQLHHPIHTDSPPRTSPVGSMMIPYQNDNQEYYPRQTAPIYARRSVPANILQMRVTSQPIRFPQYIESEPHYSTQPLQSASIIRLGHQQTIRVPYPTSGPVQVHLLATRRSESPQRAVSQSSVGYQTNQYVVARGTQTSMYYQNQPRAGPYYHQTLQQNGPNYNNRTLLYGDSVSKPTSLQYNNNYPLNTNRPASPIPSLTSSPTRMKPQVERGVPEGAASTSPGFPQDSLYHLSQSTNIPSPSQDVADSPIVPVQPITSSTTPSSSSVFYSMNV